MTSERKIAANRANGRKSRGPKTVAGKLRSSRNARRHGLATIEHGRQLHSQEIEEIATRMCGDDSDHALYESALMFAESEFLLRCAMAESVAVVERLRNIGTRALADGDKSLVLGKARGREAQRAYDELVKMDPALPEKGLTLFWLSISDDLPLPVRPIEFPEERHEADALQLALPDLARLARYSRRAWSRRKRALQTFIDMKLQGRVRAARFGISSDAPAHHGLDI